MRNATRNKYNGNKLQALAATKNREKRKPCRK